MYDNIPELLSCLLYPLIVVVLLDSLLFVNDDQVSSMIKIRQRSGSDSLQAVKQWGGGGAARMLAK